ncbi:MAG: SURF1 family cytochrome oxidase biogenesis protein, partial [Halopseudomonas sp.]
MSKDADTGLIKQARFTSIRLKLVCVLLGLTLLPVLIGLGVWQLQRADEKRSIIEHSQRGGVLYSLQPSPESLPHAVELQVRLQP